MRSGEKSRAMPLNPSSKAIHLSFSQSFSHPSICFSLFLHRIHSDITPTLPSCFHPGPSLLTEATCKDAFMGG